MAIEPYLDGVPGCPIEWEFDTHCIATGGGKSIEACNAAATVLRVISGIPTLVCVDCANELDGKSYVEDPADEIETT